jgi:hypothetical protein
VVAAQGGGGVKERKREREREGRGERRVHEKMEEKQR